MASILIWIPWGDEQLRTAGGVVVKWNSGSVSDGPAIVSRSRIAKIYCFSKYIQLHLGMLKIKQLKHNALDEKYVQTM